MLGYNPPVHVMYHVRPVSQGRHNFISPIAIHAYLDFSITAYLVDSFITAYLAATATWERNLEPERGTEQPGTWIRTSPILEQVHLASHPATN